MELQREVIDKYGVRYGGMSVNDWRHIIEAYTPMVRQNAVPKAEEISMQPEQIGMADLIRCNLILQNTDHVLLPQDLFKDLRSV